MMEVGSNRAWWHDSGVLCMLIEHDRDAPQRPYDESDAQDALVLVDRMLEAHGRVGQEVLIMADMRVLRRTTSAARRTEPHPLARRIALLVSGPISRMLGNAYVGIVKPAKETRLFTDEASAVTWLTSAPEASPRQ